MQFYIKIWNKNLLQLKSLLYEKTKFSLLTNQCQIKKLHFQKFRKDLTPHAELKKKEKNKKTIC